MIVFLCIFPKLFCFLMFVIYILPKYALPVAVVAVVAGGETVVVAVLFLLHRLFHYRRRQLIPLPLAPTAAVFELLLLRKMKILLLLAFPVIPKKAKKRTPPM
jgi:hypothetical protein